MFVILRSSWTRRFVTLGNYSQAAVAISLLFPAGINGRCDKSPCGLRNAMIECLLYVPPIPSDKIRVGRPLMLHGQRILLSAAPDDMPRYGQFDGRWSLGRERVLSLSCPTNLPQGRKDVRRKLPWSVRDILTQRGRPSMVCGQRDKNRVRCCCVGAIVSPAHVPEPSGPQGD